MVKTVFLDIDGVLNRGGNLKLGVLEPDLIQTLNEFDLNNTEFVITSMWRYLIEFEELLRIFQRSGFRGKITGCIEISDQERHIQIDEWIRRNPKSYVVIDDKTVKIRNLVKVDSRFGISLTDVKMASFILQNDLLV